MKKYGVLASVLLAVYFLHSFFLPAGGIGADSLSYFGIAADLPNPETNLFPLGYPVVLRIFFEIFHDYFWAAKALNVFLLTVILIFSFSKNFYFRETVLLLVGKTVFYVFTGMMSESLFLFLLYFLVYFLHQRFEQKIRTSHFLMYASVTVILLFTVRYSAIYLYLSFGVYWLWLKFNSKKSHLQKDFFLLLLVSGVGIGVYLLWNYNVFGSFTGEDLRGKPSEYLLVYFIRDFFGMVNAVDPYILIKPASNSVASLGFQFLLFILDLLLAIFLWRLFKNKKSQVNRKFHVMLWVMAAVYIVALFFSGIFQQIEEMNVRMLAAANFLIYFSVLTLYFTGLNNDRFIFRLAVFFLFFLTVYSLKTPVNFLEYKAQVGQQMPKFENKKYIFNDERNKTYYTTYRIPIINKEIKYAHTNFQQGEIKQNIAGTINPKIKWLKQDTVKDKSKVLYTSQILLK